MWVVEQKRGEKERILCFQRTWLGQDTQSCLGATRDQLTEREGTPGAGRVTLTGSLRLYTHFVSARLLKAIVVCAVI